MSITEKKRLSCFYHYGGERRELPNGTFQYVGGKSGAMLIEEGVSEGELLSEIGSCLHEELDDKLIFHNTKTDKTKCVCVRGDNGVKMLFYLNEDEVDVFIDNYEYPMYRASTRVSNFVESNETPRGKKLLACLCYYDGRRTVNLDGTFEYDGGCSGAVVVQDDVSYDELLSKICNCLRVPKHSAELFYNTKRDKTKYLRLFDQNGVEALFHLNDEEVDVFVEEDGTHRESSWDY